MVELSGEGTLSAGAAIELATRIIRSAQLSGEGTLSTDGRVHAPPARAYFEAHAPQVLADQVSITEDVQATLERASVIGDFTAFLDELPVSALLLIYVAIANNIRDALSDPQETAVGLIAALPVLALVIRAINRRRDR